MKSLVPLVMLGLVDSIVSGYAVSEISYRDGSIEIIELPVNLFPCEIKEGDFFYVTKISGVTEVRCGEPPD